MPLTEETKKILIKKTKNKKKKQKQKKQNNWSSKCNH